MEYLNLASIDNLLTICTDTGYDFVTLREGTLGYGRMILLSPDDEHWNFEINEIALNCWSSGHTVRRFRKVSKKLQKEIEEAYNRMEKQEAM